MNQNIKKDEVIQLININYHLKENKSSFKGFKIINYFLFIILSFELFAFIIIILKKKGKHQKIEKNPIQNINNNITIEKKEPSLEETLKINNITKELKDAIIYSEEELKYFSIKNIFKRTKDFIQKSSEGILLYNSSINLSDNPKISVVIPIYNCEKTIKRAIYSIKNQNFSDFEIILINDFSTDNSINIIKDLQKNEPRIKIINNKKNMGILYTRCIGTLSSKGKFIFPLDDDDMFIENDVFSKIAIDTAEKHNFDIVEFRVIKIKTLENFFDNKISLYETNDLRKGVILYQPELSNAVIRSSEKLSEYKINDRFIWGKCIKTDIYKKAIELYGEGRYSNYVITFENLIMNYIIFQLAQSLHFIPKYGILHEVKDSSIYLDVPQTIYNKYEMRLLDAVFDFSKNTTEGKKIVGNIVNKVLENEKLELTLENEKYKILFNSILNRIYNCNYINDEHKNIIKEKSSKFIKRD